MNTLPIAPVSVARRLFAAGLNGTIDAINIEDYETCSHRHFSFPDAVVASTCRFAPTLSRQTDAAISRSCNRHRRQRRDSNETAETRALTGNKLPSWESALSGPLTFLGEVQIRLCDNATTMFQSLRARKINLTGFHSASKRRRFRHPTFQRIFGRAD
jgi:hypothetical protein